MSLVAREGPSESAAEGFPLRPGLEVRMMDAQQGWQKIRLPNGLEGWVKDDTIGPL